MAAVVAAIKANATNDVIVLDAGDQFVGTGAPCFKLLRIGGGYPGSGFPAVFFIWAVQNREKRALP